jgi:hypothetical protein
MAQSGGNPLRVVATKIAPELPPPHRGYARAVKAVGEELKAPKVNSFTYGKTTAR